jgi:hypothetical protein
LADGDLHSVELWLIFSVLLYRNLGETGTTIA